MGIWSKLGGLCVRLWCVHIILSFSLEILHTRPLFHRLRIDKTDEMVLARR